MSSQPQPNPENGSISSCSLINQTAIKRTGKSKKKFTTNPIHSTIDN